MTEHQDKSEAKAVSEGMEKLKAAAAERAKQAAEGGDKPVSDSDEPVAIRAPAMRGLAGPMKVGNQFETPVKLEDAPKFLRSPTMTIEEFTEQMLAANRAMNKPKEVPPPAQRTAAMDKQLNEEIEAGRAAVARAEAQKVNRVPPPPDLTVGFQVHRPGNFVPGMFSRDPSMGILKGR